MNFEAVIGLEIHVEMKTKSKMFSSSANNFDAKVNENISPLDFAFPGTLPVVNKEAVRNFTNNILRSFLRKWLSNKHCKDN